MNVHRRIVITRSLLNSIRAMSTGLSDIADDRTATMLKDTMKPMYRCVKHLTDGIVDYFDNEVVVGLKSGGKRKVR